MGPYDINNKNLLSHENSPYLLQHADNPVHWMSWNENSLALARQTNKPILLSIGYSACHWCHVMAHESFEDQQTADLMNELFINIKVDKEERPDLDKIYQNAHSMLTERPGGWPLTVFLTPDTHMPIFAGTYFPPAARHGLPAFSHLLQQISDIWLTRKTDIQQQSGALQSSYQRIYESSRPETAEFNRAVIDIARNQIEKQFDSRNGGFSSAPKFPHPSIIEFALKHWSRTKQLARPDPRPDHQILHTAIFSLEKMAEGGLFDHIGGGFCRYSTDELWMIPHFEKMLYDNGPLLSLYSQAWKIQKRNNMANSLFFDTACETANWVMREMQSEEGGYYSAQDADSEGSEGKFFVWSKDEINTLLDKNTDEQNISAQTVELFKQRFGLDKDENFEGFWHLHGYIQEQALAIEHKLDAETLHQQFQQIRQTLFEQRDKRVHPETDTKILCAWNGLMIHGMSMAGRLLEIPDYIVSTSRAAYFIKNHCWVNNQLFASYKDGKATLNAYIDDYAFLIHGLLELLQGKWDNELYTWTLELADKMLVDFEDSNYGGFYFTSHNHEALIQRLKSFSDDAIPSGNAVAAYALNRLGYLSGQQKYIDAAENCLKSAWSSINHYPVSHCALLNALNEYLTPPDILIIRSHAREESQWSSLTRQYYLPFTLVYNIPADQTPPESLSSKIATETSLAYPCSGMTCHSPISSLPELETYLQTNCAE
ncbi:MAG: thioredoxin domain-containing protein [Proteobacteria bacterium]|nr:thioredoxin domain-containing protein [Pseudomonadota bacterium]